MKKVVRRVFPLTFGILLIVISLLNTRLPQARVAASRAPESPIVITAQTTTLTGSVTDETGASLAGIFVTAASQNANTSVTVVSDESGTYNFPPLAAGAYDVYAHQIGYEDATPVTVESGTDAITADFVMASTSDILPQVPASTLLSLLPDSEERNEFIIDCSNCHQLGFVFDSFDGFPTAEEWESNMGKMVRDFGVSGVFPIIGPRDVESTVAWLAPYIASDSPLPEIIAPPTITGEAARIVYTEYPYPRASPHDIYLLADKRLIITGMDDGRIWVLDPTTGEYDSALVRFGASARAATTDAAGNWWILYGTPTEIARYNPATEELTTWNVGVYGHDVLLDENGMAWTNSHIAAAPSTFIRVDPAGGELTTFTIPDEFVPENDADGRPIPYGMGITPDGKIWGSDLHWNRIYSLDPTSGEVKVYPMPEPESGPRRFAIDANGILWIPEYGNNKLAKFDPATETFTEYEFPTSNVAPYVVKIDNLRGSVWIATASGDMVVRFDPATETFVEYRLPTPRAFIRHMAVDEDSGDVWISYHHIPDIGNARLVRLQFLSE